MRDEIVGVHRSLDRLPLMRHLLSRWNLLGVAGAAVAGLTSLTGVFGGLWPLAVAGAYGVAALLAPRETGHRIDVEAARAERDIRRSLDEVVAQSRGRTDAEVAGRISEARRLTLEALETAPDLASDLPTIRQIALEYLPRTVENYLNVPKLYRRVRRGGDGRSARTELMEQLELLTTRLQAVVADVGASELRDLSDHGIFLETRFSDPLTW